MKPMNYYDYDENQTITCAHCGWSGKAKDGSTEYFDQLMVVDCPACLEPPSLLMVEYPTIKETKAAAAMGNEEAESNLPVALLVEQARGLNSLAEALVKERITGFRKGTIDDPNWEHSFRVRDILHEHDYSYEVLLGGLLHDIIEDGNTSLKDLADMGFPDRVVELVDLCSHYMSVVGSEARWTKMMARLVDAKDGDAWAIKIADIIDNLRSCHTMPEDKQCFMRSVKGELMLRLSKPLLGDSGLWRELEGWVNQENK